MYWEIHLKELISNIPLPKSIFLLILGTEFVMWMLCMIHNPCMLYIHILFIQFTQGTKLHNTAHLHLMWIISLSWDIPSFSLPRKPGSIYLSHTLAPPGDGRNNGTLNILQYIKQYTLYKVYSTLDWIQKTQPIILFTARYTLHAANYTYHKVHF